MNATPIFKSNSCLASTASASFLFGSPSVLMARSMLSRVTALNLARRIRADGAPGSVAPVFNPPAHASITSKHIFSPSRSQSRNNTR